MLRKSGRILAKSFEQLSPMSGSSDSPQALAGLPINARVLPDLFLPRVCCNPSLSLASCFRKVISVSIYAVLPW
jgi:hypothetical protein